MSESLVLRVKRLISGSVNGVVDALETANAEVVMREAVREIERATDDVREELARTITTRHQTNRLLEHTKGKLIELTDRAKLAVDQARDDLAEAALSRQLDLEAEIPVHKAKVVELTAKQSELEGYIAGLAARQREMENDIAAFASASETAAHAAGSAGPGASVATKAERRADQAQQAFERAMGGSSAAGGVRPDRETSAKLHELDRLTRSSKVAERLASLKSNVRAG
jgi:phage shock protein A